MRGISGFSKSGGGGVLFPAQMAKIFFFILEYFTFLFLKYFNNNCYTDPTHDILMDL